MLRRPLLPLLPVLLAACGGDTADLVLDAGRRPAVDAGAAHDAGAQVPDGGVEADAGELDAGPPPPRFEVDVAPILQLQCQGCHFVTDNPPQILIDGDFTEETFEGLVSMPAANAPLDYVTPGSPDDSYLLRKIEDTHRAVGGEGNHMPPPVARRRVPAEDVAIIRAWIEAGAPF